MPTNYRPSPPRASAAATNLPLYIGFTAGVIFFVISGYSSYQNTLSLQRGTQQVERCHAVIGALKNVLSSVKDAETGQRGFLITGEESYLQPYQLARTGINAEVAKLREFTRNSVIQSDLMPQVEAQIESKLVEMEETISLRRERGFEPAREVVITDRGKQTMDGLRSNLGAMEREEKRMMDLRTAEMNASHRAALASGMITAGLGIALSFAVTWLIRRAHLLRMRQEWSQNGRLELNSVVSGEKTLGPLAESILGFLTRYVDAHAGAIFILRKDHFQRVALVGSPLSSDIPEKFKAGEGLLGLAVVEKTARRIDDVPEGYLMVGSGLGQGRPRHLLIVPASTDGSVNAVLELGFLHPVTGAKQEFLQQISELVGVAVKSALYREHLQELLTETQQQAEELQAQSEELRVSNEELEEQGRALGESQSRLELQQAELEQINTQLEEQTQILERQKSDLQLAKVDLENQAREVEQASRYKSDFLANMSHELRTPLNSTLILAKLLAKNPKGNLTEEQVKYALTIESAGEDLLTLINDVLDLSKIEAGHMEMNVEPVKVQRLLGSLRDTFAPMASQKSLELLIDMDASAPEVIETDPLRLVQVLKNLLSNALKFTEQGTIKLRVAAAENNSIAFSVSDTGIGIAPDKQRAIFDPFLQADGTTARKYGGTGLGLSISRNLARLLGGEILLSSELGEGSTFSVVIPVIHDGPVEIGEPIVFAEETRRAPSAPPTAVPVWAKVHDDRESLTSAGRVILVVEDDEPFAGVVYDLAHDMRFECLIATTAEEALVLAKQFLPSAIVLDVGLPDNSGLVVLERLKSDSRTRHIPVHVVSAGDYTKTAMALGAVGYMLKPVKRDELAEAFRNLETRFTQKMRRVLVVEDDPVQVEAMCDLLGSGDVEAVCAQTAAECLEKLSAETFDCMVLDLSLPDSSGFALLEKLSLDDNYSFPPVIVYTGRQLTHEEEQKLRRYSKSIIIKGAKSPERLLDEVTLFLHQVVSDLPEEKQRMIESSNNRDSALEGRSILVAEDDVRNIFALTSLLEGRGVKLLIARNGREAVTILEKSLTDPALQADLVLMDIMMPEMDGLTAMREIRKRSEWSKLPIIALTAKAMKSDQEQCLQAGANDYLSKPLDVEKLLSLIRVWMPR
ncbi:response regulator [Luteolibacter yonseiensis]|uniref:histidine kinase n=1 Tax=Luteolibacter yonseiensis TaxID=1144680 RepID=A0A934V8M8_9BACT|nr:response regulator [Luteolibacter yonseiensis]MBK1814283.1 response regulator [Luteolibacter yonseiensis]